MTFLRLPVLLLPAFSCSLLHPAAKANPAAAAPIVPRKSLLEHPLSAPAIIAPFKTSLIKTQDNCPEKINLIPAKIPDIFKLTTRFNRKDPFTGNNATAAEAAE